MPGPGPASPPGRLSRVQSRSRAARRRTRAPGRCRALESRQTQRSRAKTARGSHRASPTHPWASGGNRRAPSEAHPENRLSSFGRAGSPANSTDDGLGTPPSPIPAITTGTQPAPAGRSPRLPNTNVAFGCCFALVISFLLRGSSPAPRGTSREMPYGPGRGQSFRQGGPPVRPIGRHEHPTCVRLVGGQPGGLPGAPGRPEGFRPWGVGVAGFPRLSVGVEKSERCFFHGPSPCPVGLCRLLMTAPWALEDGPNPTLADPR